MSVVTCLEEMESRSCSETLVFTNGSGRIDRTYARSYKVTTSSDLDEAGTIKNASCIPAMASAYPADSGAFLISKKADKIGDNPRLWKVVCDYNSHFDGAIADFVENPLLRLPVYNITYIVQEKATTKDLLDIPITNSADVPFTPPLSLAYGIPVLEVTWNAAALTFLDLADNMDITNNDAWAGFDETTLLLKGISYSQKTENGVSFWEKKATIHVMSLAIRPLGWEFEELLDAGYYENVSGTRTLIRDQHGAPLPEPSLLNGAGEINPDGDDPVYLAFKMRRKVNFIGLLP